RRGARRVEALPRRAPEERSPATHGEAAGALAPRPGETRDGFARNRVETRMLPRSNSGRCPGLRAAGAAVMLAALAACAVIAPQRAARAPGFDLVGRVAVTSPERAFSSSVRWSHRPGGDELWLLTPTGQAVAHIRAGDDGATLTTAERHEYSARDVEALTRRALGW